MAQTLAAANEQLERQTLELTGANKTLRQQQVQLAEANELLQNQAEELEVQAEELESQNDELLTLTDSLELSVQERTEQLRRDGRDLLSSHADPRLLSTGFRVAGGRALVAFLRGQR